MHDTDLSPRAISIRTLRGSSSWLKRVWATTAFELSLAEFEAVRVARAKVDLGVNPVFVGEADCCANEMWTSVDAGDSIADTHSASKGARREASAAAQVEDRSGRIDRHGINTFPQHLSEPWRLATGLKPCHQIRQGWRHRSGW